MSADTQGHGVQFWEHATDTHKADRSYYERVRVALAAHVLPLVQDGHRVLDFGCGDGEYSRLFAEQGASVIGVDVAEPLIRCAQATRPTELVDRLAFHLSDEPPTGEHFDLVSCMGVLVCILEDTDFAHVLGSLADSVAPGGHMILRESICWHEPMTAQLDGYVARYRTPYEYLELLAAKGVELLHDEHLATWSEAEARSNHLWILQRSV